MSVKKPCKISSDCFCYVCAYYVSPQQKKHKGIPETKFFTAYDTYFGMKMGDQYKSWALQFCCGSFRSILEGWMRGIRKCIPFAIPRIWREPTNHHDDCYFCMVNISKYKKQRTGKRLFIQVSLHLLRLSTMTQNCLFLNLLQRMLYHQPYRKMTMLILKLIH